VGHRLTQTLSQLNRGLMRYSGEDHMVELLELRARRLN
jgi:hypothetical protein